MPKPLGALLSLRATGVIGGHRRRRVPRLWIPPFTMPLVGALIPGVLTVATFVPDVPYYGDPFTATVAGARVHGPPQMQDIICELYQNGGLVATVTIEKSKFAQKESVSISVADGDYFHAKLTQVGTPPNEGADLVWVLSGAHTH